MLASKVNAVIAGESKWSFWTHTPNIQKYAASIAVGKYEKGLSSWSVELKSDWSVILSSSFVKAFVATPLKLEFIVVIFFGSLSKTNLYTSWIK